MVANSKSILERTPNKVQLMRDLAVGIPQERLAEKYGVTQPTISIFSSRHREEIDAIRSNIAGEFADLWVAHKAARLAEYQRDLEGLEAGAQSARAAGYVDDYNSAVRLKAQLLRNVAEELGSLPQRVHVQAEIKHVRTELVGIDVDNDL